MQQVGGCASNIDVKAACSRGSESERERCSKQHEQRPAKSVAEALQGERRRRVGGQGAPERAIGLEPLRQVPRRLLGEKELPRRPGLSGPR